METSDSPPPEQNDAAAIDESHEEVEVVERPLSLISRMPFEILASILAQIAIESPKSFVKTLLIGRDFWIPYNSALLWEPICRSIYPELDEGTLDVDDYGGYYNLFRQRPAIRFNGVYVCMARYYREGEVEGISFNRPLHEVRYFRYLWLSADGTARSLLSNSAPKHVLGVEGTVSPTVFNDLMAGSWELDPITKALKVTVDGGAKRKHLFHFDLQVASSGGKCHNKLKWQKYWCEEHNTEITAEFPLKNEKPYYFYTLPPHLLAH